MKKILSFLLIAMMLLSVASSTFVISAEEITPSEATNHLVALNILKGDENGDLMLDKNVTRYQAALFFVQAITGKTDVSVWNTEKTSTVFRDVSIYGTAIDYAYGAKLIVGRGGNVFGADDYITYQDMLVMAVRALGYEVEGMNYPYGYILAADKLELTENIENVGYKDYLTRADTAELIWNMLGTQTAYIDPLTDKIMYPNEAGLTDTITGKPIDRVTLLEKVGFVDTVVETTIVEYDEDENTVKLDGIDGTYDANIFSVDVDTPVRDYMGLPIDVYINGTVEELVDEKAEIVFVNALDLKTVSVLGEEGFVKLNKTGTSVTFDGNNYKIADYTCKVGTFDGVWEFNDLTDFSFITDDYTAYMEIKYAVVDTTVYLLVTPYSLGQYNVRDINDVAYVTLADETTPVKVIEPNGIEYLLNTNTIITDETDTVSKKLGKVASEVEVVGETVRPGEFMIYHYNETDNIITVAKSLGEYQYGKITGTNATNETIKINGQTYELGLVGIPGVYDHDKITKFISSDNRYVKYIESDGLVMCFSEDDTIAQASIFDWVIVTTNIDILEDVFEDEYPENAVAVFDFGTHSWTPAYIDNVELGSYDAEEDEFTGLNANYADICKYVDIMGTNYSKYADYVTIKEALAGTNIMLVRDIDEDQYNVAQLDWNCVDYVDTTEGIILSDDTNLTNKITAEETRVALKDNSIVAVYDAVNKTFGFKKGILGADGSYVTTNGKFISTNSNVIMLVDNTGVNNVTEWSDAFTDLTKYYYILNDAEIELSTDGDNYITSISNALDLDTFEIVDVEIVTDTVFNADVNKILAIDDNNVNTTYTIYDADKLADILANDRTVITTIDFEDANSITLDTLVNKTTAVKNINMTVITLTNDITDCDFDNVIIDDEEYVFDMSVVNTINAPESDVFDNFINTVVAGKVADIEDDEVYYDFIQSVKVFATYEDGIVDVVVVKTINVNS